jgi:phospholipid/cholesterol/gamma-HCH transport system substrate-binding protein
MSRLTARVFEHFGKGVVITTVAALVVAVGAGIGVYYGFFHQDTYRVTADFGSPTPGLYPGNNVSILGVPTGKIVSVTPERTYVRVVMELPADVKLRADAHAVLMAPNPVSDRSVELYPPYVKGPVLAHGAVIPPKRTVVPLEIDSIFSSVDTLASSLGPSGANSHGALSSVLHAFARLIDGNGAAVHRAISTITAALPAFTRHPGQLRELITGLDNLTTKLAARNGTINQLYDDLSTATGQLADERQIMSSAIINLQSGLGQVSAFIQHNAKHIGTGVQNLNSILAAVMQDQRSLIKTFDVAPLGFQNFNRAISDTAPCLTPAGDGKPDNCTAIFGRVDLPSNAADFVRSYCGKNILMPAIPLLLSNVPGVGKSDALDTVCTAEVGLLVGHDQGPPNAPHTPDLDLTHYLASR